MRPGRFLGSLAGRRVIGDGVFILDLDWLVWLVWSCDIGLGDGGGGGSDGSFDRWRAERRGWNEEDIFDMGLWECFGMGKFERLL